MATDVQSTSHNLACNILQQLGELLVWGSVLGGRQTLWRLGGLSLYSRLSYFVSCCNLDQLRGQTAFILRTSCCLQGGSQTHRMPEPKHINLVMSDRHRIHTCSSKHQVSGLPKNSSRQVLRGSTGFR
eukprot:3507352-Amphidinium_carterae.1